MKWSCVINVIFIFFNIQRTCRIEYCLPVFVLSISENFFDENPEILLANSSFLNLERKLLRLFLDNGVGLPLRGISDKEVVCRERLIQ